MSKYYTLTKDKEASLFVVTWRPDTAQMTGEEFQEALLEILEEVKTDKPRLYLANTQHFVFPITVELQAWANDQFIVKAVELGLKKMATVLSADIFAQVSIEQSLYEDTGLQSQHFPSVEDARAWLT